MSKFLAISVAVLTFGVALAGCATEDATDTPTTTSTPATSPTATTPTATTPVTTPDNTTDEAPEYALEATNVPTTVEAGVAFTFTLNVTGDETSASDHVGAHWGPTSLDEPTVAGYGGSCAHQAGALPGLYTVECTLADEGTFHLRGHARLNLSGELVNYWSDEHEITVRAPVGTYELAVTDMPTLPVAAGDSFNFTLTVTGDETDVSDHIGAHFGLNATDDATVAVTDYAHGCAHAASEVPGTFTVTCTVPETAATGSTYYLRGHVRITVDAQHNFWSPETTFVVL